MKKNKIMAIIASTVMAAGTCAAAMSSFAATYVAPDLEQAQDITKVMIVYNFTSMEKLYEDGANEAEAMLAGQKSEYQTEEEYLDALSTQEAIICSELELRELAERKSTRKAIAEDIGISLGDVTYYGNDPDSQPIMECELTPEQLVSAKENKDILAVVDFSLGDWYEPMNYDPIELFPNEGEKSETYIEFVFDEQTTPEVTAHKKSLALKEELEAICYSAGDYDRIVSYYDLNCEREIRAEEKLRVIKEGVKALGLNEKDVSICDGSGTGVMVNLTQENIDLLSQIALDKNNGVIQTVSYIGPENDRITDIPEGPANYWLWYENIDDTPIINEAAEKADDYLKELENSDYSSQKIEQMYADYFRQLIREKTKAAYSERAESIMAELGIDNNKAAVSQYAPLIICELTPEQVAAAENCQYVASVSLYEPISDAHDATDSQPMTALPYELKGDANNDIKVNLNDAVAILQYIALPEKYPLNSQGMLNADCDGVPGISGGDALWVQQQDAENMTRK